MSTSASSQTDTVSSATLSPVGEAVADSTAIAESHATDQAAGDDSPSQSAGSYAASAGSYVSSAGEVSHRKPRPPKLYRIGEVVDYSGVSRQTIHNYTTMGLIHESRWTNGGHRLYDESVFERLDKIAEMKAQDKSLQEIGDFFVGMDAPQ
jgi:hypothetical protein